MPTGLDYRSPLSMLRSTRNDEGPQGFGASPPGLAAIVVACASWSLGSVWARQGLPRALRASALAPGAAGYASQMLAGGVLLLAMSWLAGERPQWPPDARPAASWLYLVVAATLLAFTAYMLLLERSSAALASRRCPEVC